MSHDSSSAASTAESMAVSASRRDFLRVSVGAFVGCPLVQGCEFVELRDTGAGRPGGDGSGDTGSVTFSINDPDYAALATVGGHSCIIFGPIEFILLRASDTEVIAFERFCPHSNLEIGGCGSDGMAVRFNADARQITCIWHGSRFNTDGTVISGPSPRALQTLPVAFDSASGVGTIDVSSFS
jgi:Rieske Fe-S protein